MMVFTANWLFFFAILLQAPVNVSDEALLENASGGERLEILLSLGERYHAESHYTDAIEMNREAIELAKTLGDSESEAKALLNLGRSARRNNDNILAETSFKNAEDITRLGANQTMLAQVLLELGMLEEVFGRYDQGLIYLHESLALFTELGDDPNIAAVNRRLGAVHYYREDMENSERFFREALTQFEKLDDLHGIAASYNSFGVLFSQKGEHLRAIEEYQKSIRFRERINDREGVADTLNNIGVSYFELGELDKSLEHYGEALSIYESLEHEGSIAMSLHNMGELYKKKEDYGSALDYLQQSITLADRLRFSDLVQDGYLLISQIYEAQAQHDQALAAYRRFVEAREAIREDQRSREAAEIQARYELESQNQEIALLRKETDMQRQFQNAILIGLLLTLIGGLLLFNRYKAVQVARREVALQHEEMTVMDHVVQAINRETDPEDTLLAILREAVDWLPSAERGVVLLKDHDTKLFQFTAVLGYGHELNHVSYTEEELMSRFALNAAPQGDGIYLTSAFNEKSEPIPGLEPMPKAILVVEVSIDRSLAGFWIIANLKDPDGFGKEDVERVKRFRGHAVSAILNAERMRYLQEERNRAAHALSEMKKAQEQLKLAAITDPLTHISNRRGMMERLRLEDIRFQRNKSPFVIVLGDIDYFKPFNDRYGHDCGDHVLVTVAQEIRSLIRAQDGVARWGGEEFLLLLPDTAIEGGQKVVEKIRQHLASLVLDHKGLTLRVTMSFGLSAFGDGDDVDSCIKKADEALYRAKEAGRNRVMCA